METIRIDASTSYNVIIGSNILDDCGKLITACHKYKKAVVITDDIVSELYLNRTLASLEASDVKTYCFVIPHGETSKSHIQLIKIYDFLSQSQITRADLIVALGGGVVGDLSGFAAATYLRGLDYVQIPTTLLAQTDSSIGGKTAVNIDSGKNLVGAFKQPVCVISDIKVLNTLTPEIFSDGMGEIVKYAMIKSAKLFDILYHNNINDYLEYVIKECVNIKKSVVEADEHDVGERMLLNFGHTFGHSIERYYNYNGISHGQAVGIGMCIISDLCEKHSITTKGTTQKLIRCLEKYKVSTKTDIPLKSLISGCFNDKKRMDDNINLIVCDEIGKSHIMPVTISDFRKLVED